MVFDDKGKPMSIEEIVPHAKADETKWLTDPKRGGPYKLAMGPYGDNWNVYKEVKEYMMLTGYNAMPIVYSLRVGESFTRYLDPGLEDGKTYMFWAKDYYSISGKPVHGPQRTGTFLDDYPSATTARVAPISTRPMVCSSTFRRWRMAGIRTTSRRRKILPSLTGSSRAAAPRAA